MARLIWKHLLELSAIPFAWMIGSFSDYPELGFTLGIVLFIIIFWLRQGLVLVNDNRATPIYNLAGNYRTSHGPGLHLIAWPALKAGDPVDTGAYQVDCEQLAVSSIDNVQIKVGLNFAASFSPNAVADRQKAAEHISLGGVGRMNVVRKVASDAAVHVIRNYYCKQLMSGATQNQIQEKIAAEAGRRLALLGFNLPAGSFRVSFHPPASLADAFIQMQAAGPNTQAMVSTLHEITNYVQSHPNDDIQNSLDAYMLQVLQQKGADPLTMLLARTWFRQRGGQGPIP